MTSQVRDSAEAESLNRSTLTSCGAPPGARTCPCAAWLDSGYLVSCEGEVPVEGPAATSVVVGGGLAE
jgi:hypothetical protein